MSEAINIDFRSSIPVETKLSNFNPYPFTIDDVECASMEGFLQSLKTPEIPVQRAICELSGRVALRAGRELPDWRPHQTLYWNGLMYNRHSEGYIALVTRAYEALADQNEVFRDWLLSTGSAKLTHKVGKACANDTILTEREFCTILTNIRNRLQYSDEMEF